MSYLPRMSKTYKEPEAPAAEEPDSWFSGMTLKPASSLLNEKTQNPQIVLKHYKYLPHAPPVLPGPSVLEEALENELYREASRMRRSASGLEAIPKTNSVLQDSVSQVNETITTERESKSETTEKVKRSQSKKAVKGSKTSMGRRKSTKTVKRESTVNPLVNSCLVGTDIGKPFTAIANSRKSREDPGLLSNDELASLKREKSALPISADDVLVKNQKSSGRASTPAPQEEENEELEVKPKKFISRSVQCTIFGSLSKLFVIPAMINSLLRTLAFLFHELNKEESVNSISGQKKSLMTQIQLLLGDLCSQKVDNEYSFDTTYSDFKRFEKILGELKKFMKDVYGDKGEYIDKMEDLKKVFIELKRKEMELAVLKEKLQEREEKSGEEEAVLRESDLKNPEITLQNRRLEGEQLLAEAEFSLREMKSCQKTIAELDWDIRNSQEQIATLKKSVVSRSKTEMVGRKLSVHKFSSEVAARGSRSKEIDGSVKKKT